MSNYSEEPNSTATVHPLIAFSSMVGFLGIVGSVMYVIALGIKALLLG